MEAKLIPFSAPLTFAPSASQQYHVMQLEEGEDADDIADRIAEVVHDVDHVGQIEDRRTRATVRYAAVHAMRSCDDRWVKAATQKAVQHCARWMREEGGTAFRDCSDEHLAALAVHLAPRIVRAFLDVTEGRGPITPLEYLRIKGAR